MSSSISRNILFVLGVISVQLLLLNRLNISSVLLPLVYPMILFSIVRNINRSLLLVIGFALGLLMDLFANTGGAHAVACTLIAFVRPFFLSSMGPMDMGSEQIKPSIESLGLKNYGALSFFLLAIHHIVFFILEVFSFENIVSTFFRIIISLAISWVLVMAFQYLFNSKKR